MSGHTNDFGDNSYYWGPQGGNNYPPNYYEAEYAQFQNQSLDFKPLDEYPESPPGDYTQMYPPSFSKTDDIDEPPLLEELEIYPDRIVQKILAVLNPFRGHALTDDAEYLTRDSDLAGPITFYLILAICLFLSGSKANFGYIYGISVLSCLMMYSLLTLMTSETGLFSITTVASILGYSLIPIIALSVLGVFITLTGFIGIILAVLAIFWSSFSASRLFIAISGDKEQQLLTAYPCALVSGVYVLLVVFN